MHLTRFELNTARRGARRLLGSPQSMHAAVLASYPTDRSQGRVLWRVDEVSHGTFLYVLGPDQPDLTHLVEQAGWTTTQAWDTRNYQPVLDAVKVGRTFAFRLCANPVRAIRAPGGTNSESTPRGKRVGHVTAEQQLGWFLERALKWGVEIPSRNGEPHAHVTTRRRWQFKRGGRQVTLSTAVYEGTLQVTDPDAFRAALVEGAGPAKAYGCGLFTLAPAE